MAVLLRERRLAFWIGLLLLALGAWAVVGQVVVPPIIDRAYHEQSLPFINKLIPGRHLNPVEKYQGEWRQVFWLCSAAIIVGWALLLVPRNAVLRLVGQATPGTIGAIRSLVFAIVLASILWEDLPSLAYLPDGMREQTAHTMTVFHLLHKLPIGFAQLAHSHSGLALLKYATAGFAFLAMIGLGTRVAVPLGAVGYFLSVGLLREYSWFYHTGLLPIYLGFALCFMPSGDGWSMDRAIRIARGRPVPDRDVETATYGLCRYVCWMLVALPYVAAGLSKLKLGGLTWWQADNLRHFCYFDSLNPMHFQFDLSLRVRHAPDAFFALLGLSAVIGEAGYGLALFFRWARLVFPLAMGLMHAGILLLQNILFFDLIPLQAIFFDWRALRKWVGRKLAARRGLVEVLYDGWCPLCQRTVAILGGADLFERLHMIDFRTADLAAFNASHRTGITAEDLERQMYFVDRRGAHGGYDGYRRMAWSVPLFWAIAPVLYLPGVSALGRRVYSFVADRRTGIFACDESCRPDAAVGVRERAAATRYPRWSVPLVYALAGVFAFCWLFRVEKFPLTAMQMYHTLNTEGELTYVKAYAHFEDGSAAPARFEKWIGAVADSRYRPMLYAILGPVAVEPKRQEFVERRKRVAEEFLQVSLERANVLAPPGRRVRFFEVQEVVWDYKDDIDNPGFGVVQRTVRYPAADVASR